MKKTASKTQTKKKTIPLTPQEKEEMFIKLVKKDNLQFVEQDWIDSATLKDDPSSSLFAISQHIENLFCQRFNYLVLAYSLFVTAFATINAKLDKLIMLGTAFFIILLLSISVYRVYIRFDTIMKLVYKIEPVKQNPYCLIYAELSHKKRAKKQINWIMGWGISLLFLVSIIAGFITIITGAWPIM